MDGDRARARAAAINGAGAGHAAASRGIGHPDHGVGHRRGETADLVALKFGEPDVPVGSCYNPGRLGVRCGNDVLRDFAGSRDTPDLVGVKLGKPERAIRPGRNVERLGIGRRQRKLRDRPCRRSRVGAAPAAWPQLAEPAIGPPPSPGLKSVRPWARSLPLSCAKTTANTESIERRRERAVI